MYYHFKIHREGEGEGEGFWAECIELTGCVTQGDSMPELKKNMEEALNLYLDEPLDSDWVDLLPDDGIKTTKNVVKVPVEPEIAFSVMVRHYRKKHSLSQNQMVKLLNMKNKFSYQRLKEDPTQD